MTPEILPERPTKTFGCIPCWVNKYPPHVLFPGEVYVIFEDIQGERRDDIVPEENVVVLGASVLGDAIQEAYVWVHGIKDVPSSGGKVCRIISSGIDQTRIAVSKDQIVFAFPNDTVWEKIKKRFMKEEGE